MEGGTLDKFEVEEALGGRAGFAITQAADKVRRAYARPVFAKANQPLPVFCDGD